MAIYLDIMDKHTEELSGEVYSASQSSDAYNGLGTRFIFGSENFTSDTEISLARSNCRAYIRLCVPVLNHAALSGKQSIIASILGIKQDVWKKILNYSHVYVKSHDEWMSAADVQKDPSITMSDILVGPCYIQERIKYFDIEEAIYQEIYGSIISPMMTDSSPSMGFVNHTPIGGYHIVKDYYWHVTEDFIFKAGKSPESLDEILYNYFATKGSNKLSYLLNLPNKDVLNIAVQQQVVVLPPTMRPALDKQEDLLSKIYAQILITNGELQPLIASDFNFQDVLLRYRALDREVCRLQLKSYKKEPDTYKSITDKLMTKEGALRHEGFGKRQDWSLRSTIIINPWLSFDTARIPKIIIKEVFKYHLLKAKGNAMSLKQIEDYSPEAFVKECERYHLFRDIPVLLGRQPTLHGLSVLAFKVEPTDGKAIEISPLVCPGYNADFDGDTMHGKVCQTPEANWEAQQIMSAGNNIFLPKSGECTIVPRQDILYGLYYCTKESYKIGPSVGTYETIFDIREAVIKHRVKVWDTVTLKTAVKGSDIQETDIAGVLAFRSCFKRKMTIPRVEINKKTIKMIAELLTKYSPQEFLECTNSMVELGFKVAHIYSPSMSTLGITTNRDEILSKYYADLKKPLDYYKIAFYDEDAYKQTFKKLSDRVSSESIRDAKISLPENNGFLEMARCGARGSDENLRQIFYTKGAVVKADGDAFNCIIDNCYDTQLTPLEHFLTAYGGRKGLIDKTLNTADTGYLMRQMIHTAQHVVITEDDCGTTEGLPISKKDIKSYNPDMDSKDVEKLFKNIIIGRYEAKTGRFITDEYAKQIASSDRDTVEIRSLLKCKKPYCAKCYGTDLFVNKEVAKGTAVGIIAGQSLGEPGTQLTMDSFHGGGIVTDASTLSSFETLARFLQGGNINSGFSSYDPIAWATGEVVEQSKGISEKEVSIAGSKRKLKLPADCELKSYVRRGENMCVERGTHSLPELCKYASVETAQLYLCYLLNSIYSKSDNVNFKHYEVMALAMTMYTVLCTDRKDLKVGLRCNRKELLAGSVKNTKYLAKMYSIKEVPKRSLKGISRYMFEEVRSGLLDNVLLGLTDDLSNPLQCSLFGKMPKVGTYFDGYLEDRRR